MLTNVTSVVSIDGNGKTSSSAMAERSCEHGDFKDVGHFEAKF